MSLSLTCKDQTSSSEPVEQQYDFIYRGWRAMPEDSSRYEYNDITPPSVITDGMLEIHFSVCHVSFQAGIIA
eukprot:119216-Pelagomonas_calceolata.AAC.2